MTIIHPRPATPDVEHGPLSSSEDPGTFDADGYNYEEDTEPLFRPLPIHLDERLGGIGIISWLF